jgi:PAS domain S-box-containing protein
MSDQSPGAGSESTLGETDCDRITVLAVDDDSNFLTLTANYLERGDDRLTVVTETSVSDALDRLASARIDCVVSDYDLSERDGIEFLETVREEYGDLPFILFTSRGSEEVASEAISAGVTDYLQKGSSSDQYELLSNRIVNSVDKARAKRKLDAQRRQLEELHRATREMMAADTLTEIAKRASDTARDVLDLPLNGIYFYDDDHDRLVPEAVTDEVHDVIGDPPVIDSGEGVEWTAYETSEPQTYSDVRDAPDPIDPDTPIRSELHVPLGEHGLLIAGSTTPGDFAESDITSAEILAANLTASLDRAERERRQDRERERFEVLFDRLTQPIVEATYVDGEPVFERVNDAFEAVFGYEEDDVVGESVDEYLVPEDRRDEARKINQHVQCGGRLDSKQVTRRTADGKREFLLQNAFYEDENGTSGFVIYTDITEQKEDAQELERRNELFANALEVADVGAWSYDARTGESFLTDAVYEIHGFPTDANLNLETVLDRYHPEDRPTVREAFHSVVQSGDPYDLEVRLRDGDGGWRRVRIRGEPWLDGGTVAGVRGTIQDAADLQDDGIDRSPEQRPRSSSGDDPADRSPE